MHSHWVTAATSFSGTVFPNGGIVSGCMDGIIRIYGELVNSLIGMKKVLFLSVSSPMLIISFLDRGMVLLEFGIFSLLNVFKCWVHMKMVFMSWDYGQIFQMFQNPPFLME